MNKIFLFIITCEQINPCLLLWAMIVFVYPDKRWDYTLLLIHTIIEVYKNQIWWMIIYLAGEWLERGGCDCQQFSGKADLQLTLFDKLFLRIWDHNHSRGTWTWKQCMFRVVRIWVCCFPRSRNHSHLCNLPLCWKSLQDPKSRAVFRSLGTHAHNLKQYSLVQQLRGLPCKILQDSCPMSVNLQDLAN